MSLFRSQGIDATYLRIIDETVSAASCFQSPAVLEQLKQRWIEKITARLHKPPVNYKQNLSPSTVSGTANENEVNPLLHLPAGHTLVGNQQTQNVPNSLYTNVSKRNPVNENHQALIELPCTKKYCSDHSLEKHEGPLDEKSQQFNEAREHRDLAEEEQQDDDEWNLAEWESAEPSTNQCVTHEPSQKKIDAKSHLDISQSSRSCDPHISTNENTASLPNMDQPERGIVVKSDQDLYDDLDEIDEDSLSDLEDHDPAYSDIIVAQFESVQRPHARKPCHRGQWKLKLRRGILQIDGQELLFNTMTGESAT